MGQLIGIGFKLFERYVDQESRPLLKNWASAQEVEWLAISNALGGEVGELQNKVKKLLREQVSEATALQLRRDIVLEAGDILHYLIRFIHAFGYTVDDIIEANISKLEERKFHDEQKNDPSAPTAPECRA